MAHKQENIKELGGIDQEKARKAFINAREHRGLSQEWVAEEAGYSITQYVRIENGDREITTEDLWKIAMANNRYDHALKSPFQRKLTQIKREIHSTINQIPHTVIVYTTDENPLVLHIRARAIAMWTAIYIVMLLVGITPYKIGFVLGTLSRLVQNAIS